MVERRERDGHDLLGCLEVDGLGEVAAGDGEELRARRTGAERKDAQSALAHLLGDRLGEREDVGLRRPVRGHARGGLVGRGGGDVDEDAATGSEQLRQQGSGELGQRHDVEGEHLAEAVRLGVDEGRGDAEAGVVDQRVDGDAMGFEIAEEVPHPISGAEIMSEHVHRGAMGVLEFAGERLEPVPTTGDEDEIRPASSELPRELGP